VFEPVVALGILAQGAWGTDVPQWGPDQGEAPVGVVCRHHSLQILTAVTIKIWKFRIIHLPFLGQLYVSRWMGL